MLKYCIDKWDKNKDTLKKALMEDDTLNTCNYLHLVEMVVEHILNGGCEIDMRFDVKNITLIDNGEYQGCQIFAIPKRTYHPAPEDYLFAFQYYGSCSGCDTLISIQEHRDGLITENQLSDFMSLCKDIVCTMVHPFRTGWFNEIWEGCEVDDVMDVLDGVPTVDAEPVRHGRWLPTNDDNKKRCSECDVIHLIAQYPHGQANYCPNCGAKMDEGVDNVDN